MKNIFKIFFISALSVIAIFIILAATDLFAKEKSDKQTIVDSNNAFAFNLYEELSQNGGNLFFSPSSISTALAMAYAGAQGNTATQMASALHFSLDQERLHPAFRELMKDLTANPKKSGYQLSIANALWIQTGYEFHNTFTKITNKYYGAGLKEVDFIDSENREKTRKIINSWVEDRTNDKIKELIKPEMLGSTTRLILTNAIYFKGKWELQFNKKRTKSAPFTLKTGEKVDVSMMNQTEEFNYTENDILQILEMPYIGDNLSMVILLPKKIDGLKQTENLLAKGHLENWLSSLRNRDVIVSLPKFKMTSEFTLNETLKSLGMVDAFSTNADFSGMTPDPAGLYISNVIHKAFVDVNEEGTEAAAATALSMVAAGMPAPKPIFKADHVFMFIIRDTNSGNILFMGRVEDPR